MVIINIEIKHIVYKNNCFKLKIAHTIIIISMYYDSYIYINVINTVLRNSNTRLKLAEENNNIVVYLYNFIIYYICFVSIKEMIIFGMDNEQHVL